MVAKIKFGKHIPGAIIYNELKVAAGQAQLIGAYGFHRNADKLSLYEKMQFFKKITELNRRAKTNCIHISLNFHPEDVIDSAKMREIATQYLEGIGLGDQPCLVYQHWDTRHPHTHLVTTNIGFDGKRIQLDNIGKGIGADVRRRIETDFDLIKAEGRGRTMTTDKGDELSPVVYGQVATKASMDHIVSTVIRRFRFESLEEFNTILSNFNVFADAGLPGTQLNNRGGLQYFIVNSSGSKVSVPIKASLLSGRPTLKFLEGKFRNSSAAAIDFSGLVKRRIDQVLFANKIAGEQHFKELLRDQGIYVVTSPGHALAVAGSWAFVDTRTGSLYRSEQLGANYFADRLRGRIAYSQRVDPREREWNHCYIDQVLSETDYKKGFAAVLNSWAMQGVLVKCWRDKNGQLKFNIGHVQVDPGNWWPADKKISSYLQANHYLEPASNLFYQEFLNRNPKQAITLDREAANPILEAMEKLGRFVFSSMADIISVLLESSGTTTISPFLMQQRKRKKKL
ncbi:MAG TPA: relaxase/mobilization nuclease domain-containing protein [Chitinophaga sp.]|uniref:relaxase/mobilization nuclease domain-containing protein n=1 Tax=Chitinophaga sp. TaxID=1869181 RepID=UPI002B9C95F9|nr:relaxase/mobilization nuclease domain-containing protein [Chitinophaga sp.]HVI44580.1 relaxase/mobilization nuclease domain-containing protein [Chitinophaga sp.]